MAGQPESENVEKNLQDREDSGVSMLDVLEEEKQLEEESNAVLGGSDEHNCTYDMGYVSRQALYSCMTCQDTEPPGVCLACSLECHDGHDLVELYTKRQFRCDCGNSRMPNSKCKLIQNKQAVNADNQYNQNFRGLYCTCHRPYPDEEEEVEDEMVQCVVCEDWYHGRHLGASIPENDAYDEMICADCMARLPFLRAYTVDSPVLIVTKEDESSSQEIEVTSGEYKPGLPKNSAPIDKEGERSNVDIVKLSGEGDTERLETKQQGTSSSSAEHKNEPSSSSADLRVDGGEGCSIASEGCKLSELQKRVVSGHDAAIFWPEKWRTKLCVCHKCKSLYNLHGVSYLLDPEDTIHAYEERGKKRQKPSDYDRGMTALSHMDRSHQVEMLQGYHDMKSALTEYLKGFAERNQVVTEEDIRGFFEIMQARKRQKTQPGLQHFCK